MNTGWFKLHRKIIDTSFYCKPLTCHLAIHLLMIANTEDKETFFNGQFIKVKRGECIVGRNKLSRDTGLSEQEIKTASKHLLNCHFITSKSTNRYTLISILKYDDYQGKQTAEQPAEQPATNQQPTTSKELKNKELILHIKDLSQETLKDLQEKFPTKDVPAEYDKCVDWIESTGKKYKDYVAMFRNWLRRSPDVKRDTKDVYKEFMIGGNL